ncbi:MAG: PQQ-dependent sugar dehydrogenase [Acidimicrobiales bacterium]
MARRSPRQPDPEPLQRTHRPYPPSRPRRALRSVPWTAAVAVAAVLTAGCADTLASDPASGGIPTTAAPAGDGSAGTTEDGGLGGEGATDPAWMTTPVAVVPVATVTQPTALTVAPNGADLWITERQGRIRLLQRDTTGGAERFTLVAEPVLDLSDEVGVDGEGGLLGLVPSQDGTELFVNYTDRDGTTVVAAHPVTGDATVGPAAEARTVLTIDQPYSNHNGGDLHIGPDRMLYISVGDGGSGGDPLGSGQDTGTLLGSLLRIDPTPSAGAGYTVPADNPLVGEAGTRPEIWLYGVRNPWRFSFDPGTGDLWIGDVGQNRIEEIDRLPAGPDGTGAGAGDNLGWNRMEGNEPYDTSPGPPASGYVGPILTYTHDGGACSVTGGEVVRDPALPGLDGVYLFADFCRAGLIGVEPRDGGEPAAAALTVADEPDVGLNGIVAFGRGPDNELYTVAQGGAISRIVDPGALDMIIPSG